MSKALIALVLLWVSLFIANLTVPVSAAGVRDNLFVGYSEKDGTATAEPCKDELDEEDCDSYASVNMCRSAYVKEKCRKTCKVATDHAFDLPPLEEDLGFLRRCYVLATLCHMAYSFQTDDLGSVSNIELPLAGALHDSVAVTTKLIHFKEAEIGQALVSPQQYGIWNVSGLGLVVAFRGTASSEDVFIDANITPVPLVSSEEQQSEIHVHRGFYEGAKQHTDAIVEAVRRSNSQAGRPLPVWVTGHSLGGAYANCMMLHLLESRKTAQLFESGGGSVTFGAPMALYATDAAVLYQQLAAFEEAAEATYAGQAKLQFHNFVNNADIVPRLLGTSLDTVHDAVEGYIPSMKAVRQTARNYHPFGAYHLVMGSQVRTLKLPSRGNEFTGRLGDAAYAEDVNRQLNATRIWKSVYATGGKGAGVTHHSIMSYQERLISYMSTLARAPPTSQLARVSLHQEAASANMTSLFSPTAPGSDHRSAGPALDLAALDTMGRALGEAAQVAVAELGTSALTALNQRMRAYTAASAATTASSATENGESTPVSAWTWSSLASRAAVGAASHEQDPLPAGPVTRSRSRRAQAAQPPVQPQQQPQRQVSGWFTSSRWTAPAATPSETEPPASWQELGAAVGTAFLQYMQQGTDVRPQDTQPGAGSHSEL